MAGFQEKVATFEHHVSVRQIGIAERLAASFECGDQNDPLMESGFVILSAVMAYFEMIAQAKAGTTSEKQSTSFFLSGFRDVYPNSGFSEDQIRTVCGWVRCGMYHDAMPKFETYLDRNLTAAFQWCNGNLCINPAQLVRDVRKHFTEYVAVLRASDAATQITHQMFVNWFDGSQIPPFPRSTTAITTPMGTPAPRIPR